MKRHLKRMKWEGEWIGLAQDWEKMAECSQRGNKHSDFMK